MVRSFISASLVTLVFPSLAYARGDGTFQTLFRLSPLRVGLQNPVAAAAGDFNRDGKLDLAAVNGTNKVTVLLQDPVNRLEWKPAGPFTAGSGSYSVRAADLDGDGDDDLMISDPGSTAYFLVCRGDGTFDRAVALTAARGSREIAIGDWNGDGKLDLASANHDGLTVPIFLGGGDGTFRLVQTYRAPGEPHALKTLDYDGDGKPDLMVGIPDSIVPLQGMGDGKFTARSPVRNLGCSGRYLATGDFNNDGKGDLICDSWVLGLSLGNGSYQKTFTLGNPGLGLLSNAIADLDGDGFLDLVFTSALAGIELPGVSVYQGKGDGRFLPPVFLPASGIGTLQLARDLDGDGRPDLLSTDPSGLLVVWGKPGRSLFDLASGIVTGFSSARALAVADLDRDLKPDLFLPSGTLPRVDIYLNPGFSTAHVATTTRSIYTSLEVTDLDGNGTPDLAGFNRIAGTALVALLDSQGKALGELEMQAGLYPSAIVVDRLDEGLTLDLATACTGSNHLAVFTGLGGGAFAEISTIPTIEKPRDLAAGDLDGDGRADLAVISSESIACHYGKSGGELFGPATPIEGTAGRFSDLAIADLDGDGRADLLVSDLKNSGVFFFRQKGNRELEAPVLLKLGSLPVSVALADLDGNGLLDITAASSVGRSLWVLLNRGPQGLADPVEYPIGFNPLGHRIADLDLDGALDLVAFKGNIALILFGRPAAGGPRFRRGDVDGNGRIEVNDPIVVLSRLFLGGEPVACEDAADANDDGELTLTDPIVTLNRLFLGGELLPPPGDACGEDPTPDGLAGCATGC